MASSGILLLDKPRSLSSNAALQRVRALFDRQTAGHGGSLDPLATGMLPICLGEATKIAGEILAGRKCYHFTVTLGTRTATGDAEGEVTGQAAVPRLERPQVESVLSRFLGAGQQVPPMYSALKRGGQPLYRLARAGVTVERAARAIEIVKLRLLALAPQALELEVLCSKGTYVRVLAEDIAAALDTARATSYPMPATALAYQLYTLRSSEGDGALDYSAIAKSYERTVGDEVDAGRVRQKPGLQ